MPESSISLAISSVISPLRSTVNLTRFRVHDLFEGVATDKPLTKRFDDLVAFANLFQVDTGFGTAVVLTNNDFLRHIDQSASQIAGASRPEARCLRHALSGAVGRHEEFENGKAFVEVRPSPAGPRSCCQTDRT